jgi:glycine cleavage system H protein
MTIPAELRYTAEHEWVAVDGPVASVGITDYAQRALGDVSTCPSRRPARG